MVTARTHHIARTLLIGAIAVTAAVAGVAAIAVTGGTASTTGFPTSVTINNVSCGEGWLPPRSGQR